jgi:signal peptidase II
MKTSTRRLDSPLFHLALALVALALDQASKSWALIRFQGIPRAEAIQVIGDAWRWQLAYNEGAAFSMRPQQLIPFLSPTVFYTLLSVVAVVALTWFYRKLPAAEWPSRLGVSLIAGGAVGNLVDRLQMHKVVDFIDWDFPNVTFGSFRMERWPTFNLADTWVLVGVAFIFLTPWLVRITSKSETASIPEATPAPASTPEAASQPPSDPGTP